MWLTPMMPRREGLLKRLFNDLLENRGLREGNGQSKVPAIDMQETDLSVVVETELPGVNREDVNIEMEGDVLSIRGVRREEKEEKGKTRYVQECRYGLFERKVRLPVEVESEKAEASFDKGILKITLPKKAGGRPRTTPIRLP